ncbi:peptidoglycan-binding protein [Actinoplanes sp. LDG1-06]|uniref:Peptidoglycan-binding protein n=1 Tax=Paractinoplanes ovalisporus TaxID=2810368 RepID=A0ABS2A586_9ACTN|nr:peptidoglycan-binding domain-containing protein [Actinoplanes ovalisporus]MBM2615001.1 peptidoglycan-binding protein [Actinoplanes ovalisporus]
MRKALIAGGLAVVLLAGCDGEEPAPPAGGPGATTKVTKTDLVETRQVDGTLGYAGTGTIRGGGSGTLTWLPKPGDVIQRGERVYGVDNRRIPLLYGGLPFWRELGTGVGDGPDVEILERNLKELGFGDSITVDDHFTAATAAAVRRWQKKLGQRRTGRVAAGDAIVRPGAVRVAEVKAQTGSPASGDLLTSTGTTKQVVVDLPAAQSAYGVKGAKVTVGLPGGGMAGGRITTVGTTATATDGKVTIPVTITLDDPAKAGALDGAPVTVHLSGPKHKGVLTVPVDALLATADGHYAVQVLETGGATRLVPVELGVFANGRVAVTGAGVTEGLTVTVPRS